MQSGELKIILPHQPGKLRYACLFTRGLLLCAKKVKKNCFKIYYLNQFNFIQWKDKTLTFRSACVLDGWELRKSPRREVCDSWNSLGQLVDLNGQLRMDLYAQRNEIQEQWSKAFAFVFNQLNPCSGDASNEHRFKLHTFTGAKICCVCSNLLKGLMFQVIFKIYHHSKLN